MNPDAKQMIRRFLTVLEALGRIDRDATEIHVTDFGGFGLGRGLVEPGRGLVRGSWMLKIT